MKKISPYWALSLFLALFLHGTAFSQILINEYSGANWKQFYDNFNKYEDWIELHNTSNSPINISGYFLSDNPNNVSKWVFPTGTSIAAKGFLRVWCSGRDTVISGHYHSNFRITQTKNTPEILSIATPTGLILDAVEVVTTQTHQSMARLTDGASDWRICTQPTPNGSNQNAPMSLRYTDRPSFDKPAGFYADSVTVTISTDEPMGRIVYTLDGTEPTQNNETYTQPIKLAQTTVVKARVFSDDPDVLPGLIQFRTYFVNVSHTMVVVSIAADTLLNLANGDNTLRPIGSIEYFGKDKTLKTRSYGELNSHGQDSWANDQRSLDWISRDEFGYSAALKEKIFSYSDRDEYQRVILRASGDDNYPAAHNPQNEGSAHLRDDYVQTMAKLAGLSLDVRASERCIVFLNGKYWGVYSLRELPDDHDYTEYYYGQGKYDIQYIQTWGDTWAEYGGDQALLDWNLLRSYILNRNMADSVNYKYVTDRLDVKSLVDYIYVNTNSVCSDWLNYNTGWWRGLNPEGGHKKWGYSLWDNDATFGFYINYTGIPDTSPYALPCDVEEFSSQWGSPDPEKHLKILERLRNNPNFNQLYLSRQADLDNTAYSCQNMLHVLDSMVQVIEPEMAQHAQRWYGNYNEWKQNVARLRYFVNQKCQLTDESMLECFPLDGPYDMVFKVEPPEAGSIVVNTLPPSTLPVQGAYFGGMDQKLSVLPTPNTAYVFDRWESNSGTFSPDPSQLNVNYALVQADTVVAIFKLFSPSQETLKDGNIRIFPTVFEEKTTVFMDFEQTWPVSIQVFNAEGRAVMGNNQGHTTVEKSFDLDFKEAQLPKGLYFVQIRAGTEHKTYKVIKL